MALREPVVIPATDFRVPSVSITNLLKTLKINRTYQNNAARQFLNAKEEVDQ